ncbi:MAG TPA: DUF2059 domain-containing protein [Longimicrobium sp.]|nr:DUF2059 domain-containing protein [Longimicrobium sp.]
MKKHLWIVLLLACAARPATAQVSPGHRAAIEELFAALGAEREMTAGVEAEIRAAAVRNPALAEYQPLMLAHARRYLRWPDLKEDFVRVYARTYTEPEARELAAFYRTPVGQKSLRVQSQLVADVRRITQERLRPHARELTDAIVARARAKGKAPPR